MKLRTPHLGSAKDGQRGRPAAMAPNASRPSLSYEPQVRRPARRVDVRSGIATIEVISRMFEQAFKNIDDVLRKEAGCTTELDYTEQTSWLLFLKYLDGLEQDKSDEAALEGKKYDYILSKPFRWDSWAAPKKADGKTIDDKKAMGSDDLTDFVDDSLFP